MSNQSTTPQGLVPTSLQSCKASPEKEQTRVHLVSLGRRWMVKSVSGVNILMPPLPPDMAPQRLLMLGQIYADQTFMAL
ncbi:hypothetical protein B0I35DRAFT_434486 [Stachybotrys elegans]|uniref:Uncharacterized protein n=1 Tax=Stachybotrys elegans TaxID=80388 RepID=A0A8K0SU83_9HYPO|nr:hypothetical protein B0I35DRAFT_434486 [Stachybotrys elegans]